MSWRLHQVLSALHWIIHTKIYINNKINTVKPGKFKTHGIIFFNCDKHLQFKIKKKLANNLLEKLVLLLLVWYAIACHAITVTNLHFTWCSVVINLMFNTVKPLSIFSERNIKNKQWMQEKNRCEIVMYSKIFGRAIWKYHYSAEFSF
jgi:hypothetical protein